MATQLARLATRACAHVALHRFMWAPPVLALVLQACGGSPGGTSTASSGSTQASKVSYHQAVGPGVIASPGADADYNVGAPLSYNFVGLDPAATVIVKIDGVAAAASGVLTMNTQHEFEAVIDNRPGLGNHAPDFSGTMADGVTVVKLSDYKTAHKYVFVDFSEQTCPGSVNEASYLQAHRAAWQAKGLEIVTVLVHGADITKPATTAEVVAWQAAYGLTFPVLTDTDSATGIFNAGITPSWSVEHGTHTDYPAGYIIDDQGVILYKFTGFDGPTIDAAIAALFPS